MRQPRAEDRVELMRDMPDVDLHSGAVGVICATWFMPDPVYEIEFTQADEAFPIRSLVFAEYFRIIETAAVES